jgi:predicted transcriptional regulator
MRPTNPPYNLGELELLVLERLWSDGPGDAKAVHRAIGRPRKITVNTIQSTLKRLHDKDLLSREKVSHAYVYAPRVSREAFQRHALHQVVDLVMEGQPEAMVSAFADLTELAGYKHLERLERLVEQRLRDRKHQQAKKR